MVINVKGSNLPPNLRKGILTLGKYGYLKLQEDGILVTAVEGTVTEITKAKGKIRITYDTQPHFYMALARSFGMGETSCLISAKVKDLGLMLDCSRNAVPKPEMVKKLICLLVLFGYTYLELYTEDTYELPGEPYFGYGRGRYSAEELKEIITFADIFQLEVVPCIQTLAHMNNLVNWNAYVYHMDIDDILLVGDDWTYNLIRKSLRFCKEVFHTSRINIGTDEAFHLGRGRYIDRFGYKSKHEIYLEHLKRVFEICREEGFYPEFWGDAFYDTECSDEEVQALFDGTQTPIYWEYSRCGKEQHYERLMKLKNYAGKVSYSGGLWKWIGYAPDNGYTEKALDEAFVATEEIGVEDILLTAWGDNGNECSVFAVIPSMWYAAAKLYPCDTEEDKILRELTGYTGEEWRLCDCLNYVMPKVDRQCNAAKYLLHNDYLVGLMDYNTPDHAGKIYEKLYPKLLRLGRRRTSFSYLFQSYAQLAQVLIRKATFGKRLRLAYQENDVDTIKAMTKEIREIQNDLKRFYKVYRVQWMKENKGYGFEVLDLRIGGLISRVDTVVVVLKDYLAGKSDKIYELEDERIEYFCGALTGDAVYAPRYNNWATIYTANRI